MQDAIPFLRFIHISQRFSNRHLTQAYDCRLIYVLSGTGILRTENEDLPLRPDTLAYYPAGIRYQPLALQDDIEYITVNFDFTSQFSHIQEVQFPVKPEAYQPQRLMDTQNQIQEPAFSVPFVLHNAVFLRQSLLRICDLHHQDTPYQQELCSTLLKLCLLDTLHHRAQIAGQHPVIDEIRDYLEQNYRTIPGNQAIAQHFRYHSYYLNQLFRRHTGKTLHQYLTDVRLRHSQELLCRTDLSIAAISEACGFQNPDHFSRLFHQHTGFRATAYRKQFRNI